MDEGLELPSEEKGGLKRRTEAKKRVEAFIPSEKTDSVLARIRVHKCTSNILRI